MLAQLRAAAHRLVPFRGAIAFRDHQCGPGAYCSPSSCWAALGVAAVLRPPTLGEVTGSLPHRPSAGWRAHLLLPIGQGLLIRPAWV